MKPPATLPHPAAMAASLALHLAAVLFAVYGADGEPRAEQRPAARARRTFVRLFTPAAGGSGSNPAGSTLTEPVSARDAARVDLSRLALHLKIPSVPEFFAAVERWGGALALQGGADPDRADTLFPHGRGPAVPGQVWLREFFAFELTDLSRWQLPEEVSSVREGRAVYAVFPLAVERRVAGAVADAVPAAQLARLGGVAFAFDSGTPRGVRVLSVESRNEIAGAR